MPRIFQINTSDGGVPKLARLEAEVTPLGVAGDRQEDTRHHGGPERAVCLYSLERILALQAEGHPVFPGAMGENITLTDLDWMQIEPGMCLRLGEAVRIQLTRFTTPCNSLKPFFIGQDFSRVLQDKFPGWSRVYGRVLEGGNIKIGDQVEIELGG